MDLCTDRIPKSKSVWKLESKWLQVPIRLSRLGSLVSHVKSSSGGPELKRHQQVGEHTEFLYIQIKIILPHTIM